MRVGVGLSSIGSQLLWMRWQASAAAYQNRNAEMGQKVSSRSLHNVIYYKPVYKQFPTASYTKSKLFVSTSVTLIGPLDDFMEPEHMLVAEIVVNMIVALYDRRRKREL